MPTAPHTVAKLQSIVHRIEQAAETPGWNPQTWTSLRSLCERLLPPDDPSLDATERKCRVLIADILVRLRVVIQSGADAVQRIWTLDDLMVLNQRLAELGNEGNTTRAIVDVYGDEEKSTKKNKATESPTSYNPRTERFAMMKDFILDGLSFKSMNDRENQVTPAYQNTFDWIFSDHSHGFSDWLKTDDADPIYWITGLAGSGKSTLMRYIGVDERLMDSLEVWGGETEVLVSSFFFWESGTAVQRSQAGLLRSLLHQLLSERPEFLPHVFPALWAEMWAGDARKRIRLTSTWPLARLDSAFRRLFEIKGALKVCLLVDGLDEFEGDHQALIDLFRYISAFPHTKVCVSSRPWPVFQAAFGNVPGLRVQDLTAGDMQRMVLGEMCRDPRVGPVITSGAFGDVVPLVTETTARADGVFLWASLAIRHILLHFNPQQGLAGSLHFLRQLPRSLDGLYDYLLLQARPAHDTSMSRIIQLMRAREVVCDFTRDDDATAMTIWELALTDDAESEWAITGSIQKIGRKDAVARCEKTIAAIETACSGLVEVHGANGGRTRGDVDVVVEPASRKISYMHRTVKDFLATKSVWAQILALNPTLDPHVCHLRSSVLALKMPQVTPNQRRSSSLGELWGTVVLTMTHARYAAAASHEEVFDLLNTYDETLNWYYPPRESVALDSWARSCFGTYEERAFTPYPDPFLSLTTKFGVARYVEDYLDTYEYEYVEEKPLLSYAVEFLVHRQSTVYPLSSPEIVAILFKNAQDPNLARRSTRPTLIYSNHYDDDEEEDSAMPKKEKPPMKTPWILALEAVQQAHRRGWIERYDTDPNGVPRWTAILKLFLEHGADPNVSVQATWRDKEETAVHLMSKVFHAYHSQDVLDVLNLLRARN